MREFLPFSLQAHSKGEDWTWRKGRLRLELGTLFWREGGQGPAVLFLHGNWAEGSQWEPLMQALGGQVHCLAPDLLGCGESNFVERKEPKAPKTPMTIALQGEALAQFCDTLRLPPLWIVAEGIGAWVATVFAHRYPQRVQGLILSAPEGIPPAGVKAPWGAGQWLARRHSLRWASVRWATPFVTLGGVPPWLGHLRQQRQRYLAHPTPCRLLFQRRRTERQGEHVDGILPELTPPLWLLAPTELPPLAQALTQTYALAHGRSHIQPIPTPFPRLWQEPEAVAQLLRSLVGTATPER